MCRVLALVHLLLSPVISISLVNNRNTIALPRYRNRDRMPKQFLQLDAQRAIYVGLIHLLYRHSWNIRPISLLGVMSNQPDILNGETPEWKLVSGQNANYTWRWQLWPMLLTFPVLGWVCHCQTARNHLTLENKASSFVKTRHIFLSEKLHNVFFYTLATSNSPFVKRLSLHWFSLF